MDVKRKITALLLMLAIAVGVVPMVKTNAAASAEPNVDKNLPIRLWYDEEAPYGQENTSFGQGHSPNDLNDGWERWSLPLGNGYFGANVFGRTDTERIQLTEKTLANDYGSSTYNPGGLNNFSETYLDFGHTFADTSEYSRALDLRTAICTVDYVYGGVHYTREYFTSYEDYCMVIKLTADTAGALDFVLRPTIPYLQDFVWNNNNQSQGRIDGVTKHGRVTSSVGADGAVINLFGNMGQYNVDFEAEYRVFTDGSVTAGSWTHTYNTCVDSSVADPYSSGVRDDAAQTITVTNGTLEIKDATEAYIVICLGTNYDQSKGAGNSSIYTTSSKTNKLDAAGVDAKEANTARMNAALANSFDKATSLAEGYELLRARHIADYSNLFGRVSFNLEIDDEDLGRTTDELLTNYQKGVGLGHYLEMLYYQYGRYLLIASSRETTLPANLQGTWNRYNYAPWGSGYWHNVNEQMNYWPAFSANLAETFEAYVNMQQAYMEQARWNAKVELSRPPFNYTGSDTGFTLGIGVFPYSVGSSKSSGELGFTTQLFWEYYQYTRDEQILREIVYPVLYEAAQFITKTVAYDDSEDAYLSIYSYSAEQFNGGSSWYYTKGTTYAQSFAYLNNLHLLEAAEILGIADDALITEVKRQIDKYDAILVGYSGQVKEFREEDYYGDIGEYAHRHISQLVGLFPGEMINANTPAWLDAAKVTLTERGDKATGWGVAHRLNLWSHTKEGDRTYLLLQQLLKSNTATNLWDLHTPFQIDGNFGGTSGITEMLMQSHEGYIEPLSAIPSGWSSGSFSGLVARGNFTVGAEWVDGSLTEMTVTSNVGGTARLRAENIASATVRDSSGRKVSVTVIDTDTVTIDTTVGETYTVSDIPTRVKISAVSDLSVTQTARDDFALTWTPVIEAASYNVYKAVGDAPDYTLVGSTEGASFVYTTLPEEENARVTYRVCAVSPTGRESIGSLVYVNPADVDVTQTQAVLLADGSLQVVAASSEPANIYTLYKYDTAEKKWVPVMESDYPVIIYSEYSASDRYAVSATVGYFSGELREITEIGQVGVGGELIEDPDYNIFTGTTAADVTLSSKAGVGVYPAYPVINCFDGDLNTRVAPTDKQNAPFEITVKLSSTYNLKTVRIYDFRNYNETTGRSNNTKIEVFADGVWTTVISDASLERVSGKTYAEFDLGFAKAEQIRFTFENTVAPSSASLWEITATAAKPNSPDRTALLASVREAKAVDTSRVDVASRTRFTLAYNSALKVLGSAQTDQFAINTALAELTSAINSLPSGDDLDLGIDDSSRYDGSQALEGLPTVGGIGGKTADDLAYILNRPKTQSVNVYRNASDYGKDHTVEFSVLLEENATFFLYTKTIVTYEDGALGVDGWNGGPQIEMSGGRISVKNATLIAIDGVPVGGGVNLCEYNPNEWYRIALVAPITLGERVEAVDVLVNGTCYTISVSNPFYGLSYPQFEKSNSTAPCVYLDNIVNRSGADAIHYAKRDYPNILVSDDGGLATVTDGEIRVSGACTVGALKNALSTDIRVYADATYATLLADDARLTGGERVVTFAKNGRAYERVYKYYNIEAPVGHDWTDATCESAKVCKNCGITEGDPLGHDWTDATCEAPKTCSTCGKTEGDAKGHSWGEATCTEGAVCTVCGATDGDPLGHDWTDATCEAPKTCDTCGATDGDSLGHDWTDATCETAKTCSTCGKTEGDPLGHRYDNDCDTACNTCQAERTVPDHADGNSDGKCDSCGKTLVTDDPTDDPADDPTDTPSEDPNDKDGDKGGANLGVIIGVSVGAVALIALAAVLIILKKKRG